MEEKKALICVSVGSSVPAAAADIAAVEQAMQQAAPNRDFFHAYTSPTIRKILREQGKEIDSLSEMIQKLKQWEYRDVRIQPTHLLPGQDYEQLRAEAEQEKDSFVQMRIGKPLLAEPKDIARLAEVLSTAYPPVVGEGFIWMGHGTFGAAEAVYATLQQCLSQTRQDVFVGTMQGTRHLYAVVDWLKQKGYPAVHLAPLLLTAGRHVWRDMAGETSDSWKGQLQKNGFTVRCTLSGLGRMPGVQKMYQEHLYENL